MIDKLIANGAFPSVLLLYGDEDLLVEEAAARVFNAARAADTAGMSTDVIDGDGQTLDAILSIARSYPMMSERRTLWVRHFEKVAVGKSKGADPMSTYLADPVSSTVLILTASLPTAAGLGAATGKNAATTQRKIKTLKYPFNVLLTTATWMEFPAMKSSHVAAWIRQRGADRGITLSPHLCEYLVARHGSTLRELDFEIDKLATFVGEHREITEDDIANVVGDSRTYSVFELQRAVGQGNLVLASSIVERMLENDRQELLIISMLTRYFTALFKLIDARSLGGSGAIASAIGVPPFAVGDHLDALQRLGPQAVERALHQLRKAESLIKSTPIDPRTLLQTVLLSVMPGEHNRSNPVTLDIFVQ